MSTAALTELWARVKAYVQQELQGVGGTDTLYDLTRSGVSLTLAGSDGSTDTVTLPNASTSAPGVMTAADKTSLDRLDGAVRTGVGVGLYGTSKGSDNLYHRFMLTETPNLRHDTSPDGSTWTTKEYFVVAYQPGDTFTQNMSTAGYVTSSSKNVVFFVPLDRPVSSQVASVTCQTKGTMTLRGTNGYCHGSSASASVTPSSVSVNWRNNGLEVTCVMSATTNAVNNTPVGISMSNFVFKFN